MIAIRSLAPEDMEACLEIYGANLSQGMIPEHYCGEFEEQLRNDSVLTLVATVEGRVVACGCVQYVGSGALAWLSFGLVHPDFQRRGIGSAMVLARMGLLEPEPGCACVVWLSATRVSKSFFAKQGFGWHGTETDAHGNEFERLALPLSAAVVEAIRERLVKSGVAWDAELKVPVVDAMPPMI